MRFIHMADIHLGASPDSGKPWSHQRGQEIWDSFRKVIETVGRQRTDLLLIAGDLFHRQPLKRELKEVNELFASIPDTRVVMIAGNQPLRPATDRRLGGPLPRQPANQTRVHLIPPEFFTPGHAALCAYAALAVISNCYSPV